MKNLELYRKVACILCKEIKSKYGVDAVPQEVINNASVDGCTEVDGTPMFLLSTWHKGRYVSAVRTRAEMVKMTISEKWQTVRPTDMAGFDYYYTYNYKLWKDSPVRHAVMRSPARLTKEQFEKYLSKQNYYWIQMGTWTNRQFVANAMRRNVRGLEGVL